MQRFFQKLQPVKMQVWVEPLKTDNRLNYAGRQSRAWHSKNFQGSWKRKTRVTDTGETAPVSWVCYNCRQVPSDSLIAAGPVALTTQRSAPEGGRLARLRRGPGMEPRVRGTCPILGEWLNNSPRSCRQKLRGHLGPQYVQTLLLSLTRMSRGKPDIIACSPP